ncbi:MAG: hypothetical protein ACKVS5_07470 [Parvularculaceae bacterium]
MHYTRLGSMTFEGNINPMASIGGTLGNDTPENIPLEFAVGGSGGGNVNFESLSSEKFYKAILASIEPGTVKYYRDQGWPDEIVMSLFVERIVLTEELAHQIFFSELKLELINFQSITKKVERPDNNKETETIIIVDNDPENAARYLDFRRFTKYVTGNFEIDLVAEEKPDKRLASLTDLKGLSQPVFSEESLKGAKIVKSGIFVPQTPTPSVKFTPRMVTEKVERPAKRDADLPIPPALSPENGKGPANVYEAEGLVKVVSCIATDEPPKATNASNCNFEIVLRSPNSALYYLGELHRAQADPELVKEYKVACKMVGSSEAIIIGATNPCQTRATILRGEDRSLFYLESKDNKFFERRGFRHEHGLFDFSIQNRHYWVPNDPNLRGRTMQMVTIINELFAQKQERSDPPAVTILQGNTN